MEKFQCRYEIEDGYAGKSSPQYFDIYESDIEDDMDETDLESMFDELMQDDFYQNIYPYEKNKDEFIEWAKEIIENQKEENRDNEGD